MSFEKAILCLDLMDRQLFTEDHIYYIKVSEIIFDQLFTEILSESNLLDDR